MSRIFITGSTDGLGRAAAAVLLSEGHDVVIHARSPERLKAAQSLLDQGATGVVGDLGRDDETRRLARAFNDRAPFDAVIHNAGVYTRVPTLHVNVVAPYLLTALMRRPARLIYLSSGMHTGGRPNLAGLDWSGRTVSGTYSDSKLFVAALAAAVARLWPDVASHSVNPGWVPTKMGGAGAPDDLRLGHRTQEWLATSNEPPARSGYWHHQELVQPHPSVNDVRFQTELLAALAQHTGVTLANDAT